MSKKKLRELEDQESQQSLRKERQDSKTQVQGSSSEEKAQRKETPQDRF